MADMGFLPAVRRILDEAPADRQTLLFSATLDGDIAVLSESYQHRPVRHEAAAVETDIDDAVHLFWLTAHEDRVAVTTELLQSVPSSIVFTRTRRGADRLAKQLERREVATVVLHGGRSQNQRTRALKAFSRGQATALIATDVAARGIHVDAVSTVVHFDPPADHKDYLHRSGRTARAGAGGTVVSIVTPQQQRDVKRLQRDLSMRLPIAEPDVAAVRNGVSETPAASRSHQRRDASGSKATGGTRTTPSSAGRQESIYIANLPWAATADDLAVLFSRYGTVHDSTVIKDRRGRSKGFGFVEMPRRQAREAIDDLQGASLEGRPLTVRVARPRTV